MQRLCLPFALMLLALAGCDSKPTVTVICPWAPGGGTDRVSRFWAGALEKELDRRVVVSNKTGGRGATGHSAGSSAKPDGNTITMITFELCTMKQAGINAPTSDDFRCIMQVNADPAAIIVRNDAPWKSLDDLLAHVKANPGDLRMSGTDIDGAWDLARMGLLRAADIPITSVVWVPSQGAAPSLTNLIGGHVQAVCCSVPEAAAMIDSGELRALAVMADERLPGFPDVPTAKEEGVDWVAVGWRGLAVPKETPDEIVERLEKACRKIGESDEYRDFMQKNRFEIAIRGPDEFSEFLAAQNEQWKPVVEASRRAKQP